MNLRKIIVAPSILSANWNHLLDDIKECENTDAKYLHFDVMDGHFVPNISFGVPVLKSIAHQTTLIKDVHLMISDPLKYSDAFIKAGADIITFHLEALKSEKEVWELINHIHSLNCKVGISIKPNTKVETLLPYLNDIDLVLIMTVEPGFGGQSFMPSGLEKISYLRDYLKHNLKAKYIIEVDGGINNDTSKLCREAGADLLVAGSYVFSGNIKERIASLNE